MNQFFQDLKGSFQHFKFLSHDIDQTNSAQRFLRAARPIVLASTFILVIGFLNQSNDEYKLEKSQNKKHFKEDLIQEWYIGVRGSINPLFLRYLDLKIDNSQTIQTQQITQPALTTNKELQQKK